MYSGDLPDEIIREILTPVLRVPDEAFRSGDDVSPFSTYSQSTSALLVVCKSWLRVATPLLYNVVVLRSRPQAQALHHALRGNKLLGTFIRKLRVEGAFGISMYHIIRLSPKISELWMPVHVYSSDSVTGLCRGLALMNPQRLIVFDDIYRFSADNAPSKNLVEALCLCISTKWDKLTIVNLPYDTLSMRHPDTVVKILNALAKAEQLRTINLVKPQHSPDFLQYVAKNPNLESIRIAGLSCSGIFYARTRAYIMENDVLKKLIHEHDLEQNMEIDYDTTSDDDSEPTLSTPTATFDPAFVALTSVSNEVKYEILNNIIYFCILSDGPEPEPAKLPSGQNVEHVNKVVRPNILLVSKQFYNFAMRHYYRYRILKGSRGFLSAIRKLVDDRSLGSAIVALYLHFCGGTISDFRHIITPATNLVHLTSTRVEKQSALLDFKGLATLATNVGSKLKTLTGFTIARPSAPRAPTVLYSFTALESLDWDTSAQLKFKSEDVPRGALPNLRTLTFMSANDSFLRLLGCMTLDKLRVVSFPNAKRMSGALEFLKIHGDKISVLSAEDVAGFWELCPLLQVVHISGRPTFTSHANVVTILLTKPAFKEGHIWNEYHELGLVEFGTAYPALEEIKISTCRWPTNERDITKSNWVKWAERLLNWDIKLCDKDGKHWKRRLK